MTRLFFVCLVGLLITLIGVAVTNSIVASDPVADKTPTIESRLRDLEYPELQKRTAEEIDVFKGLVKITELTSKRIYTLYTQGAQGGQAERYALSGLNAELAKVELAWAEGRVEDAYAHLCRADRFANFNIRATQAAYDTGTVPIDVLFDSQIRFAKTKLQLIRAEKVAKVAGVDLTAVKRRELERIPESAK